MALLLTPDEFSDKHLFLGKQLESCLCLNPAKMFLGLLVLWRLMWQCFQSNFFSCGMWAEWDGNWGGRVGVSISNSTVLIWVCERPAFKFQDARGDLKSQSQLSYSGRLSSAAPPEQNCAGGFGVPGQGGHELVVWWLGCFYKEKENWLEDSPLHEENLLSVGLWLVKKGPFSSPFLPCWCSLLWGSFTPVLDVRVHVLWLGVCGGRACCLLSLLLRADSLPAFVTRLKPSCFL